MGCVLKQQNISSMHKLYVYPNICTQILTSTASFTTRNGACQGKTQHELGLNFEASCDPLNQEFGHPKTFQGQLHKILLYK